MVAVHDYRKPLVGHHSHIVYKQRKAPLTPFLGTPFLGTPFLETPFLPL